MGESVLSRKITALGSLRTSVCYLLPDQSFHEFKCHAPSLEDAQQGDRNLINFTAWATSANSDGETHILREDLKRQLTLVSRSA